MLACVCVEYLYERHTLSDADNVVALLARVESLEDKVKLYLLSQYVA